MWALVNATVAAQPLNGLGNRLRVISSFSLLARRTDRDFRLWWGPSEGFSDEDLNDLVVNEFVRIDGAEFAASCARGPFIQDHVMPDGWDVIGGVEREVSYRGCLSLDLLISKDKLEALIPGFMDDYMTELTTWAPAPSIARAVDKIALDFGSSTVGVHVRRGDGLADPVRAWRYRISSDRAFFARMDETVRADPDATFFLATDDPDTELRYRERYGDRILRNAEKRFVPSLLDRPKDNQRDAAIDLFALSRTTRILGTYGSSFTRLAADVGGIPLERATDRSLRAGLSRRISRLRHR